MRLLLIPEEYAPPPIAERAYQLGKEFEALSLEDGKALDLVHADPAFREVHQQIIQVPPPRLRGKSTLTGSLPRQSSPMPIPSRRPGNGCPNRESMLILHDRALIALLAALPHEKPAEA